MHMTLLFAGAVLLALASADRIPTLSAPNGDDNVFKSASPAAPSIEPFDFLDSSSSPPASRRRDTTLPTLSLGQMYPDDLEYNVVGPVTNPIYLGTPAFDALVTNVCSLPCLFPLTRTPEQHASLL